MQQVHAETARVLKSISYSREGLSISHAVDESSNHTHQIFADKLLLLQVLPERYGGQAQLVSLAESVAARRAGEAAAAHEQKAAQAAVASTAGGPVTSRLAAAGSTVKRYSLICSQMLDDCLVMSVGSKLLDLVLCRGVL